MYINIQRSIKQTMIISGICLAAFFTFIIQLSIFGSGNVNWLMMNPLISGFLHKSIDHFIVNIIFVALLLIPDVNKMYNYKKISIITIWLSVFYLPIILLGISCPAIGISGTWMFLCSRYLLSIKSRPMIGKIIIILLVVVSVDGIINASDGVAHYMHLLGIGFGIYKFLKDSKLQTA